MINHPHRCEVSMHGNFSGTVWFCNACTYKRNDDEGDWDRVVSYNAVNGYQLIYDYLETFFGKE